MTSIFAWPVHNHCDNWQNYTAQHLHVHMYYIIHVHNQHLHNKVNLNQKANKQNHTYMS